MKWRGGSVHLHSRSRPNLPSRTFCTCLCPVKPIRLLPLSSISASIDEQILQNEGKMMNKLEVAWKSALCVARLIHAQSLATAYNER